MSTRTAERAAARVDELVGRRTRANAEFFGREADRIADLCRRLADRFGAGGRLIAVASSPAAISDARHIAVEFVHPVIVGKRALPALALTASPGDLGRQLSRHAAKDDIVVAFGSGRGDDDDAELDDVVLAARGRGSLTVGFEAPSAEWTFDPPVFEPFIRQELIETLYHVLWELVHVFFEHGGHSGSATSSSRAGAGAASFLYPFLDGPTRDLDAVTADVSRSVRLKAAETGALREETVAGSRDALIGAARLLRAAFDAGGTLLAFGNGGSATDAMDVVADFLFASPGWTPRRALDLSADPSILTASSNDIGPDAIFARQIVAYGGPGDVALALSTSGNSPNIVRALEEARRRRLATIALVGYDGGRVLAEGLADYVIVAPSQHIPRIQEAHATAYHLLRELVEGG